MTKEEFLKMRLERYINSGMWKYESCYLDKEDIETLIMALEQERRKPMLDINYNKVTKEEYKALMITTKLLTRLAEETPDPFKSIEIYSASSDLEHLIPDFKTINGEVNFISVYEKRGRN